MKAIIAAGGKGTRMYPLTFTSSKQLLPIANKPLILYPLEDIINLGIKEIAMVVNDAKPAYQALLGDGSALGVKITYIDQPEALGLAHVVKICEEYIAGDSFVYHLGDNIFTAGIKKPYDHFVASRADAVLSIIEHPENFRLGVPYFDELGKLSHIVEKPTNPPNKFGIPGLYMFSSKVFAAFHGEDAIKPSPRGELEIVELYNYLLVHGGKVEVAELEGEWRDPGKFDDALETNQLILSQMQNHQVLGEVDGSSQVTSGVTIGNGSHIINSKIVGPVIIGDNVQIKDSYIGPGTAIGNDCQIEGSHIEYSILFEDVHITGVAGAIKSSMLGKHAQITKSSETTPVYSFMISDHSKIAVPA